MINFVLLVACILIVLAILVYLFYWNRILAHLLSFLIRLWGWHSGSSSVWAKFGSVHFSMLAGRILFKDFRYHSSNMTVRVVKCQISWRYWIRRPMMEDDLDHSRVRTLGEDTTEKPPVRQPPCRVHVSLNGLEVFFYNRVAAFDHILSEMEAHASSATPPQFTSPNPSTFGIGSSIYRIFSKSSGVPEAAPMYPPSSFGRTGSLRAPRFVDRALYWIRRQLPTLDPRDLLPISLDISRAAIVSGNASTPNLLITEFQKANGTAGLVSSRSKHDVHKQVVDMTFQNVIFRLVENQDHQDTMATTGERISSEIKKSRSGKKRRMFPQSFTKFSKLWKKLKLSALLQRPVVHHPAPNMTLRGLRKAFRRHEQTPDVVDYTKMEYAIERKLLEAPSLQMSYYVDTVGKVPLQTSLAAVDGDPLDIGNGDLPPEWGVDIVVRGGQIRYGPWADRQRAELQRAFFPPTYQDTHPTPRLKPGDMRQWTAFKLFVEFADGASMQIPFREASKDWQWDGLSDVPRPKIRDPANINLRVSDGSTISYCMPMVATAAGYEPFLEIHLDSVAVTSSLNDIRLLTAESCRIRCDQPSHLGWKAERRWSYAISLRQPVLYLIRDHINMFTDLGKDWSSGPTAEYGRWVPMVYDIELDMHTFELNLYANDLNIIDKPLIKDENVLITARGPNLRTRASISSNVYRPSVSTIPFFVEAPSLAFSLTVPRWNTHWIHADSHRTDIGRVGLFRLDGSYQYHADVSPLNIENLKLDIIVRNLVYKTFGWSIRHLMALRDNYFGSFTHFSTLTEYLDKRRKGLPVGDPVDLQYRAGKSNSLQVELQVQASDSLLLLPAGLPGFEVFEASTSGPASDDEGLGACLVLTLPELDLQLRTHDDFMEMALTMDDVMGSFEKDVPEKILFGASGYRRTRETFVIDGISVVANRLFGPRPRNSTYVCIWEIHIGQVKASLSAAEAKMLGAAANSFRVNFADALNAPASEYILPVCPDITFVSVTLDSVNVVWVTDGAAIQFSLPQGAKIQNNDAPGSTYRKVTSVVAPQIGVKALLPLSMKQNAWLEAAQVVVDDAAMDMYGAPCGWKEAAQAQREFVAQQDELSGRAKILLDGTMDKHSTARCLLKNGLYLPSLRLPLPLNQRAGNAADIPVNDGPKAHIPRRTSTYRAHNSDSDSEGPVTEAARDARIAKTRPKTVIITAPQGEDDQSMSGGDESDSADLTDHDESESDWDWDEGITPSDDLFDFAGDALSTSRYTAAALESPSLWSESPFTLSKSSPFLPQRPGVTRHTLRTDIKKASAPPGRPTASSSSGDDMDRTVVRTRANLTVLVTPLILLLADKLIADMHSASASPELRFDAIMAKYLGSFAPDSGLSETSFDLCVASVHLRFVQSVPLTDLDDQPEGLPVLDGPGQQHHRLTTIDVKFGPSQIVGQKRGLVSMDKLSASVADASLLLAVSDLSQHQQVMTLFEFSATTLSAKLEHALAELTFGPMFVDMDHSGPDYLIATGSLIACYASRLAVHQRRVGESDAAAIHRMFETVLRVSAGKQVVDPLSTIQPSYLVQTGLPHQLRTDLTFKLLFYMRHCLRHLTPLERKSLRDTVPEGMPMPLGELLSLVQSQLFAFAADVDVSALPHLSLWRKLSPHAPGPPPIDLAYPSERRATVIVTDVSLAIRDPEGKSNCVYSIGNLVSTVISRMRRLEQFPLSDQVNASAPFNTGGEGEVSVRRLTGAISLGQSTLTVHPHLVGFLRRAVRLHRRFTADTAPVLSSQDRDTGKMGIPRGALSAGLSSIDLTVFMGDLRIQAAAEKLMVELGINGTTLASTVLVQYPARADQGLDWLTNTSLSVDEISLKARSTAESTKRRDHDTLASFIISAAKGNVLSRREAPLPDTIRAIVGCDSVRASVPRSAIRLYRFVEEWRADYLPGLEATIRELLSELRRVPKKEAPRPPLTMRSAPSLQIQVSVSSLRLALQVMPGTWFSWEIRNTLLFARSSTGTARSQSHHFGVQLSSQLLSISSTSRSEDTTVYGGRARATLDLPTISVMGRYDRTGLYILASVDFFQVTFKPSHLDTVLSVQQKFGQDFNDLMSLIEGSRRRAVTQIRPPSETPSARPPAATGLRYTAFMKMRGFRVGLQGLNSSLYLDCEDIGGGMNNDLGRVWQINVADLALSLAPKSGRSSRSAAFNRNHRSAFVVIDLQASGGHQEASGAPTKVLKVAMTKVHAVMRPTSIGEIGDFVDHLQGEFLMKKEQRAHDLQSFKEKTKSLMRTLEINARELKEDESPWLHDFAATLTIKNIGVAFPLVLAQDMGLPQPGSHDGASVRAFLFSIKSFTIGTHGGESGQATVKKFSFQFVSQFRPSMASDYAGDNHPTRNKLLYPEMTAQLRSEKISVTRRLRLSADVSGFIFDLDSSLPDYVFSLIDVYTQGKEQMDRLIPRASASVDSTGDSLAQSDPQYSALPSANIFLSLIFHSGKVRMYSSAAGNLPRMRTLSTSMQDDHISDLGAEVIKLPQVSVWGEFRAGSTSQKHESMAEKALSVLIFKFTIHSSQNTLQPTILLPFLTEFNKHVEARMRQASHRIVPTTPTIAAATLERRLEQAPATTSNMRITLSLRIDQSKLELTCQPDVNVVAGVNWESGGFIINISPGARQIGFTGAVGGLTVSLKHGFLTEDCVNLEARNLAFSATFFKESDLRRPANTVSLVVDTELSGAVRFSRLQDVLCFKAVWLDRIPVFNGPGATSPLYPGNSSLTASLSPTGSTFSKASNPSNDVKQDFTTLLLIRLRQVNLDVDFGQSISNISLDVKDVLVRTRLTDPLSELSLRVGDVAIRAAGNVSGEAHVPNFSFETARRREATAPEEQDHAQMLELSMTSGPLNVKLKSEHQDILQYRAEPVEVKIADDWSLPSATSPTSSRPLQLTFVVSGTDVAMAVTVGTIPRLVSYADKFRANLDAQREGASRESSAFRIARAPKPDNPLSAVANAMLQSARSRFKEAEVELNYVIRQRMRLQLDVLRLVVFPRKMDDAELAQLIGRKVHAQLDRIVESNGVPAKRDLRLSFSALSIAKFSVLNHGLVMREIPGDCKDWLQKLLRGATEAIIFGLPSMNMRMLSEESRAVGLNAASPDVVTLAYEFYSRFARTEDAKNLEDIYVSLNVSLYSWLTVLRKSFAREMDEVQASRPGVSATSAPGPNPRRKAPDPLPLERGLSAAGLSSPGVTSPSRFSTRSPRTSAMTGRRDHFRSPSTFSIPQATRSGSGSGSEPPSPTAPSSSWQEGTEEFTMASPSTSRGSTLTSVRSPTLTAISTVFPSRGSTGGDLASDSASPLSAAPISAIASTSAAANTSKTTGIMYEPKKRFIERLTMRQLGEATPDVMHPFFMKKAGFSLEDSLPQYVHEYATRPLEEIMKALLELYSKQLHANKAAEAGLG